MDNNGAVGTPAHDTTGTVQFLEQFVHGPAELLEIRNLLPGGGPEDMRREFFPGDRIADAVEFAWSMASSYDVYFAPAARVPAPEGMRQTGRKTDVDHTHALWADLDDDDALDAFRGCDLADPSYVVASGSLTGSGQAKVHVYWLLKQPLSKAEAEPLLRGIQRKLKGDPKVAQIAAVLRVPGC